MYGEVYSGRECTGWGVDTGVQNLTAAKFLEAKILEPSFPTAYLFTANFSRTVVDFMLG